MSSSNFLFFLTKEQKANLLYLLLVRKTSLLSTSFWAMFLTWFLVVVFWRISLPYFFASVVKGFLVAFDIFIIIFGAIFFLEILQKQGIVENLCFYLASFSKDFRVQVILLAWFLENFIEGTAGFGTPSALVAPLLVSLGLSPLTAVIISLLGNSTSVVFGAAGTPIRVGFAGLPLEGIASKAVFFNCLGFLVPVFMLWTLASEQKEGKQIFKEGLLFALWSGIAFVVPAVLTLKLGQEFPSILGSVIGLLLVILTCKLKLFLPSQERSLSKIKELKITLPLFRVIFPYALLVILLILEKFILGSSSFTFSLGTTQSINLFNPGTAFLLAGLITGFKKTGLVKKTFSLALKRTREPFAVILLMAVLVQLMINSEHNYSGLPSVLTALAQSFKTPILPFFSPFIGAFGSFLTGSATLANIMFGNILLLAARSLDLSVSLILALALVGGAAGNMIALADMLAAQAVVSLKNQERQIIKGVIFPCLIYLVLVGVLGILFAGYFSF
ncbi:MAG: L-lactate permease [Patescibacteria group bacterium]|nr:L-lactate permease [Patescibacteria group bacterium]